MTNKVAQFLLLILLSMGPLSAMAEDYADISAPSTSSEGKQLSPTPQDEIAAFGRATVSARDGIAAVKDHLAGAKVVDISFDGSQGVPVYHVKARQRGAIWSGTVDASTRSVIFDGSMPIAKLNDADRSNIADTERAGFDLSEAMIVAEKYGKGKAVSAGLSRADGKLVFLVVVVSDGALKEVSISPTRENGHRRRAPAAVLQ